MVLLCGWTEQFGQQRLQRVRPDLIAFDRGMKLVTGVHHAIVKPSVAVRELTVDIQIPDPAAVCHIRQIRVNAVDFRHDVHIVVARKDSHHDNHRVWSLRLHDPQHCSQTCRHVLHGRVDAACRNPRADVVRARQQHNHLRIDPIELAVLQPPEDVLDTVRAPPEIRRVPTEEVLVPVLEELRIVSRPPPPRDRIAFEVDIDAALPGFREQMFMGDMRILIGSRSWSIGLGPQQRNRGDAGNKDLQGRVSALS
jgi:hypothetical protein